MTKGHDMTGKRREGMKNGRFLWIIGAAALIFVLAWAGTHGSLDRKIRRDLGHASDYRILRIERMSDGSGPLVTDLDLEGRSDADLLAEIARTRLRFQKKELGMELTSALYTFTAVAADGRGDDMISVTVNDRNQIHFNKGDSTWQISGQSKLYDLLEKSFIWKEWP